MRTSLKVFGFFVFLAITSPSSIYAQDSSKVSFLIGPIGGYNAVSYNTYAFPILNEEPSYFQAENGSGWDPSFGVSAEIPLDDHMHKFLVFEIIDDSKSSNFNNVGEPYPDSSITSAHLAAKLRYILFNIGFKYNFKADTVPSGLGLQLCLSVGITNWSTFTTTVLSTTSPPDIAIVSIGLADALRIAFRPELTYDLPLSSRWILTPSIGYDYPLTKVDQTDRNWFASSAYGAIALRYAFGAP